MHSIKGYTCAVLNTINLKLLIYNVAITTALSKSDWTAQRDPKITKFIYFGILWTSLYLPKNIVKSIIITYIRKQSQVEAFDRDGM